MIEVDADARESVGAQGAVWASSHVVGMKHEVIDDQLTTSREEVSERLAAVWSVEQIVFVDALPWQAPLEPAHLVALPRKGLLLFQQREPSGDPFVVRDHSMIDAQVLIGCHGGLLMKDLQLPPSAIYSSIIGSQP